MMQSRILSFRESCENTAIGFLISLVAQALFLPAIGVPIVLWQNFAFAVFMTFVSIARTYFVRRYNEKKRLSFPVTPALLAVAAERERQKSVEGYQSFHDDDRQLGELGAAGASYFLSARRTFRGLDNHMPPGCWPWARLAWKPKADDVRRDIVRGVALGLAELELFDRVSKRGDWDNPRPADAPLPTPVPNLAHGKTRSEQGGASA